MSQDETKSLTLKMLSKYNEKVLLPEIEQKIDDRMKHYTDEILTSNDKVVKKLDHILIEQKAITVNYKRVDQRLEALEEFALKASPKVGVEFQQI